MVALSALAHESAPAPAVGTNRGKRLYVKVFFEESDIIPPDPPCSLVSQYHVAVFSDLFHAKTFMNTRTTKETLNSAWANKVVMLAFVTLIVYPGWLRAQTSVTQAQTGQLVSTGVLSSNAVGVGDKVVFWITIRNVTAQSICAIQLVQLEAPGFNTKDLRLSGQIAPASLGCPKSDASQLLSPELRQGQSVTVRGELPATTTQTKRNVTAVLGWTDAQGIPSQGLVPLGSIAVQSWAQRHNINLYGVFKDFTLPVVIVLLTLFLQHAAKSRDLKSETWKQMLPESHVLAKKFYAPVQAAATGYLVKVAKATEESDAVKRLDWERQALYSFMRFYRLMTEMSDEIGGFFFKDYVGEELACRCWSQILACLTGSDTKIRCIFLRAQAGLLRTDKLDTFISKLDETILTTDSEQALQAVSKYFQSWYPTPEGMKTLVLLKALGAIIDYEMNKPYRHWYNQPVKLSLDQETQQCLTDSASGDTAFMESTQKYLRRGKMA
jgi:hypothetical protein